MEILYQGIQVKIDILKSMGRQYGQCPFTVNAVQDREISNATGTSPKKQDQLHTAEQLKSTVHSET